MKMRSIFSLFASAALLCGCRADEIRYRYKLTLVVDTPSGERTASDVVEIYQFTNTFWQGVGTCFRGQAIFLDLGPDKLPLIVTLAFHGPPLVNRPSESHLEGWLEIGPGLVLAEVFGDLRDRKSSEILHLPREVRPEQLSDLITFRELKNPDSAVAVDPNNLEATLGPGISWRSITIEYTDEQITTGLESYLPWINSNKHYFNVNGATNRYLNPDSYLPTNVLSRNDAC